MPKHVHIRDLSQNFYRTTKDLSEPLVVTKRGTHVMTISSPNVGYASSQTFSLPIIPSHICIDYCVIDNPSKALDYLKEEVKK